jgi:hypothetical protein
MTRGNDICDMCDTWHMCDTHKMCHTVWNQILKGLLWHFFMANDTWQWYMWPVWHTIKHFDTKSKKNYNIQKICQLENEIDVTHCDNMRHCGMYVTPKVFKFIGPSKDGRRHGMGSYLFINNWRIFVRCPFCLPKAIHHLFYFSLYHFHGLFLRQLIYCAASCICYVVPPLAKKDPPVTFLWAYIVRKALLQSQ